MLSRVFRTFGARPKRRLRSVHGVLPADGCTSGGRGSGAAGAAGHGGGHGPLRLWVRSLRYFEPRPEQLLEAAFFSRERIKTGGAIF